MSPEGRYSPSTVVGDFTVNSSLGKTHTHTHKKKRIKLVSFQNKNSQKLATRDLKSLIPSKFSTSLTDKDKQNRVERIDDEGFSRDVLWRCDGKSDEIPHQQYGLQQFVNVQNSF